jgi:hypothetical protein
MDNNITFLANGDVIIEDDEKWNKVVLCSKIVRQIAEEYELRYAIEDVEMHLAENEDSGGWDSENDRYDYDREKYTPSVVRAMAKEVVERTGNSDNIQEAYWFIVDWVIDDYEKGEVDV